jgi:hypothetical protein
VDPIDTARHVTDQPTASAAVHAQAAAIVGSLIDDSARHDPVTLYHQATAARALYDEVITQLGQLRGEAAIRLHSELGSTLKVAAVFGISPTRVAQLMQTAQPARGGLFMWLYRNTTRKVDPDGRVYGETGGPKHVQDDADSGWFRIGKDKRDLLRGVGYIVDGEVRRIRQVIPNRLWPPPLPGSDKVRIPLSDPLTPTEAAALFPTLALKLRDTVPRERGKLREYVTL